MSIRAFFHERVWAHLPREAPLKQRLWAVPLWGVALPLVIACLRWLLHRSGGFQLEPLWSVMRITLPIALLLPVPRIGPWVYLAVLRVFAVVGFVVSHVFLVGCYFLIFTPVGLMFKLAGRDPLNVSKHGSGTAWTPLEATPDRRRYYRMF